TAAQVQNSLKAIPALSTPGAVSVVQGSGSFLFSYYVQFGGNLAGLNVATLTTSPSGITAGVATNLDGSTSIIRAQAQTSGLVDIYFGGALAQADRPPLVATDTALPGTSHSVTVNAASTGAQNGSNTGFEKQSANFSGTITGTTYSLNYASLGSATV